MKHIAKDVYLKRDGEWSFELSRKKIVKEGKTKGSVRYDTIGYYSNMDKVLVKLKDMGYEEWINGDVASCKNFIDEAVRNLQA